MSRRFSPHHDEPDVVEWPGFLRVYLIAIGITILLGLISGAAWIGWRLVHLHLLP